MPTKQCACGPEKRSPGSCRWCNKCLTSLHEQDQDSLKRDCSNDSNETIVAKDEESRGTYAVQGSNMSHDHLKESTADGSIYRIYNLTS